jgi:hypothetical protein
LTTSGAQGGPVKKRGAEVDSGGIQTEELVLEAELLLSWGNGLALVKKLIKHLLIELPGPFRTAWTDWGQILCQDA